MTSPSDSDSVFDPPTGRSTPDGWEDYEVPLTATGTVAVRARSEVEAAEWAREQGNALLSHVALTVEKGMERNARPGAAGLPENVTPEEEPAYVPNVPTMSELADARQRADLTQADVAAEIEVSRATVSKWEREVTQINLGEAREYMRAIYDAD